jgi:hypothetical protein
MKARLYRLTVMHQRIDDRLRMAMKRRWANPLEITYLKKMKLRVKDMIHRLTTSTGTPAPHVG